MSFTVYQNCQELTLCATLQKQISHSLPSICRSRVIIVVCSKFRISLPAEFSLQKFLSREIKQCFKSCDKAARLIPRPDSTLNGEQIYYRSCFPVKAREMFSISFISNCAWLPYQKSSTTIFRKNKHGFVIRVVWRNNEEKKKKLCYGNISWSFILLFNHLHLIFTPFNHLHLIIP